MNKKPWLFFRILTASFLIFAMILSLFLVVPGFFGYKGYKISSGSMRPVINKGDFIYVKQVKPDSLKQDDIITFYQPGGNAIITHRVSRNDIKNKLVYTIGDQNDKEDPQPVSYEDILGIYTNYKIPFLGGV